MGDSYQKLPLGGRFWGHGLAGFSWSNARQHGKAYGESDREVQRHMPCHLPCTAPTGGRDAVRLDVHLQSIRGGDMFVQTSRSGHGSFYAFTHRRNARVEDGQLSYTQLESPSHPLLLHPVGGEPRSPGQFQRERYCTYPSTQATKRPHWAKWGDGVGQFTIVYLGAGVPS